MITAVTDLSVQDSLAQLEALTKAATGNHYEHIRLAHRLLTDAVWLETEFKNNTSKAAAALEKKYFHDICGTLSLWNLVDLFLKYPTYPQWEAFGRNLGKMFASLKKSEKREPSRRITVKQFEELQAKNLELTAQLKRTNELLKIAPYYRLAEAKGFPVKIVRLHVDFQTALARNTHNVPAKTIWHMYQNLLRERLPLHWNVEHIFNEAQ